MVLDRPDNQVAKEQAEASYAQAQASTRAQAPNVPITTTDQSTRVVTENYNITSAQANVAAADENTFPLSPTCTRPKRTQKTRNVRRIVMKGW